MLVAAPVRDLAMIDESPSPSLSSRRLAHASAAALAPSPRSSPRASLSVKAQEVLYGKHKEKVADLLGIHTTQLHHIQEQLSEANATHPLAPPTPTDPPSVTLSSSSHEPSPQHSPTSGRSRIAGSISHKAQDLLFGGLKHHADHTHSKLHDKLGLTPQQLLNAQLSSSHPPSHAPPPPPIAESPTPPPPTSTPSPSIISRRVSIADRALGLLHAAHRPDAAPLAPAALTRATIAAAMASHTYSPKSTSPSKSSPTPSPTRSASSSLSAPVPPHPAPPSSSSSSSSSFQPPSSHPSSHHPRQMSISKKASDLLYGSNKSGSKLEDRLGVREKEIETFAKMPKAYQLMGLYDTREVGGAGWVKRRGAKGEFLTPSAAEPARLQPPNADLMSSSPSTTQVTRALSLSQLSQLPVPGTPSSLSRSFTPFDLLKSTAGAIVSPGRPLRSSRTTSNSSLSEISADVLSPRSARQRLVLQPLKGGGKEREEGSGAGAQQSGGVDRGEAAEEKSSGGVRQAPLLLSPKVVAEKVRAEERASRLRKKMRMVGAVTTWTRTAAAVKKQQPPQPQQPLGPASAAAVRARVAGLSSSASLVLSPSPSLLALHLGVTGRGMSSSGLLFPSASAELSSPLTNPALRRVLNPVKVGKRTMNAAGDASLTLRNVSSLTANSDSLTHTNR